MAALKIRKRTDITPAMVSQVQACAASGCTFAQTAIITGIDEGSLRRWMVADYNEGKAKAVRNVGGVLFNMATGDATKGTRPNLGAAIFYLKCQAGWRETTGIVFEEAKPTESNTSRLVELLEQRFYRLGEMQRRKKDAKAEREAKEAPAPAEPPAEPPPPVA